MGEISLHGRVMAVVSTADGGVVGTGTTLRFSQHGDVFWAEYDGGEIVKGFLTGRWIDRIPHFRYSQVGTDGNIDGGVSYGEIEWLTDGRLRLHEHYQWASRQGAGVNVFEETPESRGRPADRSQ